MASRKRNTAPTEELVEEVEKAAEEAEPEREPEPVVVQQPVVSQAPKRRVRGLSLAQYAAQRQVKRHHLGGMRAFIKNPDRVRTLEEWDKVFRDY